MSLKQIVKKRLVNEMIRAVDAPYKVLVVDKHTLKIIHAACNLNELLDENITLVESLERKRQPYPSQDAIYFISPTPESVDIVIQDFTVSRYNTSGQLYSNIHLFFTSALDDRLFFKLKQSTAIKFIKTCKEFYLDFIANESQCFSMERNMALVAFFGTQVSADYLRNEYSILSRQLTSFLISIGEFPIIRYSRMNSSERVTGRLASLLYEDLQKYSSGEGSNFQQGKSILLILDRTTDLVAPILHEFTYQAMAFDLLPSVDGRIKVGEKKEIILDESTDSLWTELRHCHIADAITAILSGFNKFITENRAASGLGKKADVTSLAQLRDMLSSVPQFQEQKGKYTNHINLVQECMGLFGKSKLSELGTIEQNLSTGETAEGTDVKHVEIDMVPLLDDPSIRLLMLYIISKEGIKDEDRRKLLEHANITSEEITAITNLGFMGIKLSQNQKQKGKKGSKGNKKKRDDDVAFDLSRYVPSLKNILQDLGDGILDIEKYPYIRDPLTLQSSMKANESNGQFSVPTTSLRTAKPSWHTKKAADSSSTDKEKTIAEDRKRNGRIIVFIIGGMTYSEMRSGYEIGNILRKDVYIGSTHIMTPASFVQNLKVLRNELKVESVMASRGSEEDLNVKASKGEAGKGWKSKLGWKAK